jgi:ribosomal protein S18 acetylase RimI-like enzyme
MNRDKFEVIWDIFVKSFSEDERRVKKKQFALLQNPLYHLDTYESNGLTVAYIAYWDFGDFLYVEHLATEPEMRGQGIAGKMLKDLINQTGKLTVLESEKPEDNISKRRIAFYERLGFKVNRYEYFQPSYGEGKEELSLLFLSNPHLLAPGEFENIRRIIYKNVYNKHI